MELVTGQQDVAVSPKSVTQYPTSQGIEYRESFVALCASQYPPCQRSAVGFAICTSSDDVLVIRAIEFYPSQPLFDVPKRSHSTYPISGSGRFTITRRLSRLWGPGNGGGGGGIAVC